MIIRKLCLTSQFQYYFGIILLEHTPRMKLEIPHLTSTSQFGGEGSFSEKIFGAGFGHTGGMLTILLLPYLQFELNYQIFKKKSLFMFTVG